MHSNLLLHRSQFLWWHSLSTDLVLRFKLFFSLIPVLSRLTWFAGCSSQWSSCKSQTSSWGEDGDFACCLWWIPFLVHLASIGSFITLGLGAFTSPLVATQFTQLRHWSFHYIVSLGIATCNTLVLCLIFGTKTLDGGLIYLFPLTHASLLSFSECLHLIGQETAEKGEDEHSSFNQILRVKAVHYLAFFILVYVGVEVTIGGTSPHRSSSQGLICRNKVGLSHLCSMYVAGVLLQVISRQVFSGVRVFFIGRRTVLTCGRVQVLWLGVSCCSGSIEKWAVAIVMSSQSLELGFIGRRTSGPVYLQPPCHRVRS